MATSDFTVEVRFRAGRANALMQEAMGVIKRARRRDRPAILQRYAHRMALECTYVVTRITAGSPPRIADVRLPNVPGMRARSLTP